MKVRHTVRVLAAINYAAVGAGIACGILSIILIILLLMLKFCQAHRYKLAEQFNSLRRGGGGGGSQKKKMMIPDEYSRTDMIIRLDFVVFGRRKRIPGICILLPNINAYFQRPIR